MYESEVNESQEATGSVPAAVLSQIREYRGRVRSRSVLPWGEHCTECVWPSCYTSCDLYDPRSDGACRQFEGGVVRVPTPGGVVPYLQKITFRRWAKLWTPATLSCQPLATADRWERLNERVGSVARNVPAPAPVKRKLLAKVSYVRRRKLTARTGEGKSKPDYFVTEVYNPGQHPVGLTLSIWAGERGPDNAFQRLIQATPGFVRERIPFSEVSRIADMSGEFQVEIVPNDAEHVTLYFGLMEFVEEVAPEPPVATAKSAKCKCVVWDLDNTVWSGTLIEDGVDGISLKQGIKELIDELDRRGILQSIASKNHPEDAIAALKRFGIDGYFLSPQIHWMPKSQSIAAIAKALNIDAGTFVFVDDQAFERSEVATAFPQVNVIDGTDLTAMLDSPLFDVPITEEAGRRREMYRQQELRDALETNYQGDYLGFLRDNHMQVRLSPLQDANLERVYELAQRTNQMNFSGNRYALDELKRIKNDESLETHVMRCTDRFGTYGIVGFAVVQRDVQCLMDLMFSCRIQAKRVEHGFLAWLLTRHRQLVDRDFHAHFRKTSKNAPSGAVFAEMGFEEIAVVQGVTRLRFARDKAIPDESLVDVDLEDPSQ